MKRKESRLTLHRETMRLLSLGESRVVAAGSGQTCPHGTCSCVDTCPTNTCTSPDA
jgi:hypothetical protein